jgi:hypothetical protein
MRRFILWIAAILITFTIGVGADRLWWHFLAPPPAKAEPVVDVALPQREVVYVPAPAPPPPPPPAPKQNLVLDYEDDGGLSAVFYVMGAKPKGFTDIQGFDLYLNPGSVESPGEIYLNTGLGDEHNYDNAPATFALVTERRIFFATSKLSGKDFEYRFDGEFLRKNFAAVDGKNKAVIRGTLTKTRNGRTVAQHEFTFRMEYMGC